MKCPKCGYLGFETVDRCRNCGYEFALAAATRVPDLPMRAPEAPSEQLPDLSLSAPAPAAELPLFGEEDDTPLITRPSPPRPPLAVRRATPEIPKLRTEIRPSPLDLPLVGSDAQGTAAPPPPAPVPSPPAVSAVDRRSPRPEPAASAVAEQAAVESPSANLAARLVAALLDVAILGGIDLLVVYLTMKICGITRDELSLLPKIPLGLFLLAQNLGYFIAFTAGGQTIGKMASGIKVVSGDTEHAPDLASAVRRTLAWTVLALPAGAGFLSMLAADRRGLHDRLADTRVVRVSA